MHGVPRREGIQRPAGKRDTMQMAAHGAPVRAHLVKMSFENVWQQDGGERREQHMIACKPLRRRFGATPDPPSDGKRGQSMLIRSPGKRARNPLRKRTAVMRDRAREFDISGQGMHAYRHRLPSIPAQTVLTPCRNHRKKSIGKQSKSSWSFNQPLRKPFPARNCAPDGRVGSKGQILEERAMGFGRGALLWLLGIPLPIILLLAIFWHH